jgi:hypothetical protein
MTTPTEKLEKMNVPKTKLLTKKEELEETLEAQKKTIVQYRNSISQLEREANTVVGAIAVLNELLNDEESTDE